MQILISQGSSELLPLKSDFAQYSQLRKKSIGMSLDVPETASQEVQLTGI